jgi:hypothetical protein
MDVRLMEPAAAYRRTVLLESGIPSTLSASILGAKGRHDDLRSVDMDDRRPLSSRVCAASENGETKSLGQVESRHHHPAL